MPKLVADPKGRYCWEANFNPVLRMSNNAVASVMFKMDLERAKYNSVLRRLDGEARHELRVSRREMEEVRRELQELKAYQQVAQLTAFKTFDPELKRRAREREERERMRQLEDEKERAAQELENLEEKERDSIRKRLERQRKEEEKRRGISYANMLLLSRKQSISGNNDSQQDAELAQVQLRNRRLSSTGNVYVTLKDIMDSDDVLQRHSDDIMNSRRPSQELGRFSSRRPSHDLALSSRRSSQELSSPSRRPSLASLPPKRRGSNAMSSSAPDLSHTAHPDPVSENVRESFVSSQPEKEKEEEVDEEEEGEQNYEKKSMLQFRNHVFSKVRSDRRRSRIGSISSLVQQVIQEQKDITENDDNGVGNDDTDCFHPNSQGEPPVDPETKEVSNIFITDISEQNKESENEQSIPSLTSTQHNSLFNKLRIASKMEKGKIDSDNDSSSSRKDTHGVSENSNPFSSPLSKLDSRQGLFEILSQLKKNREESDENDEGEEGGITDTEILDKANTTQNKPTGKPGLLRGLARFKSMANIITEKNREAKEEEGVARIKKLTAAVVMANCAAQGKVPSAFMLHHLSPAMRGEARGRVPRLETVHQESGALKLRPLQMPRSVQRQHEKKFEELMATINGAVHWKVRALRENTGTLNPRQLRRKQREQEQQQKQQQQQQKQQQQLKQERQQQQQKDTKKAQPAQPEPEPMPMSAVVVRPRRERMALPGACSTTWSLKRFVQKEVRDLLASWQPENARRLRSQRFKDRKEMALKSAGSALVGGTRHGSV